MLLLHLKVFSYSKLHLIAERSSQTNSITREWMLLMLCKGKTKYLVRAWLKFEIFQTFCALDRGRIRWSERDRQRNNAVLFFTRCVRVCDSRHFQRESFQMELSSFFLSLCFVRPQINKNLTQYLHIKFSTWIKDTRIQLPHSISLCKSLCKIYRISS